MNAVKDSSDESKLILKDIAKQIRALMKNLAPETKIRIDKCLAINNRYADCPALRVRGIDLPYAELLPAVERMAKKAGYPYCDVGWNDAAVEGRVDELGFDLYKARPDYWRSAEKQVRIMTCLKEFSSASESLRASIVEIVLKQVKMLKNYQHQISVFTGLDDCQRATVIGFSFDRRGLNLTEKAQRRFASQLNDAIYKFFSDNTILDIKCNYGYDGENFTAYLMVLRDRKRKPQHPYFALLEKRARLLNVRR